MSADEVQRPISYINSFAVIDLETNNLPEYNFNKVGVTELSVTALASTELRNEVGPITKPRVQHKLNLVFNPLSRVHDEVEKVTGLNNYILEHETPFDENAAKIIVGFISHLQQPVCLVAHNGWKFDFPILKGALENWNMSLPEGTVCVDSMRAFQEIDEQHKAQSTQKESGPSLPQCCKQTSMADMPDKKAGDGRTTPIKWQSIEQKTPERPKRPKLSCTERALKRKELLNERCGVKESIPGSVDAKLKARRALFADMACANEYKYPPKGTYRLSSIYERTFNRSALEAHQAETDVRMLVDLMQNYGLDFLTFAQSQAVPFNSLPSKFRVATPLKRKRLSSTEDERTNANS